MDLSRHKGYPLINRRYEMEWFSANWLILLLVLCCVAMMFFMRGGHQKTNNDKRD